MRKGGREEGEGGRMGREGDRETERMKTEEGENIGWHGRKKIPQTLT